VLGALAQIKQVQTVSHPARGTIRVWEQLLGEFLRSNCGVWPTGLTLFVLHSPAELYDKKAGKSVLGKRKADGSDSGGGLQRAVKKLILDAQAVSPGSAGSHAQGTPQSSDAMSPTTTQQNAGAFDAAMAGGPAVDYSNMFMGSQPFSGFPMGMSAAAMPVSMSAPVQAYNPVVQPNNSENSFDVSLESMLATYLPTTNAPSGPDDFMNRVFSVSRGWPNSSVL
jgi:hypothetical protein